ncbi:peptidyl-arginine methylase [Aureococcus anophagefferens]|uniref:Peptidyl-arginine methylase n=1 Tax=Aureococcus anophagefferens TaxID=44056 RepID=A0ABR1FME6_AURAN
MERSIFDALRVTPEGGGATATLVGALDERGALAWRESPEDEAAAHLARKKWIVAMLRDGARNEAYAAAIAGAAEAVAARFGGGAVALEIGAGTGLLTLMLCDQALGHVVARARWSRRCARSRGPPRRPRRRERGLHARQRAVRRGVAADARGPRGFELVDHGLLGEGMLPSLRECFDSGTVRRDAVCVPRAATVYAALVACPALAARRWPRTGRAASRGTADGGCVGGLAAAPARLATLEGVGVGDSAPVALAAAAADGCPHTAVLCDDRDALLASRVDARVEIARSLDDVSPRRVVVGEPFYHALEGHPLATALRFWRRANALDAAAVEPRGATVVLEALRSDELRAAYGPLPDSILDLPHGAAAAAWREAAATLVPLDLADYAYEVASETVLCAFDFERPFEDVAARVAVPDCGPVDAFALAVRFHGRGADARRLARFHVGEPGATDVLFELRGDGSCALDVVARKKRPREE